MKLDLLKSQAVSRALNDSVQYQLKRGRITALLLISSLTWHFKDQITVKLRHEGGLLTVVDRISAYQLAELTDMKQGKPSTGTPNYAQDANGDDPAGYVFTNPGQPTIVNAILLPIGHLTLLGTAELEITVETAQQLTTTGPNASNTPAAGVVKICSVQGPRRADTVLTYDMLKDLETTQGNVREIYASAVNGISFFDTSSYGGGSNTPVPRAKDIIFRIDTDSEMAETDVECLSAMTAIMGELSTAPNGLVRVFQETGSTGVTVGIKVFGSDSAATELLFIREVQVPHMTSQSLVSALATEQRKTENLQAAEPERYKALVQSGVIKPVETLEKAKDSIHVLPAPTV